MEIKERQEALVEEFSFFDDWMDKYEHLIELGKSLPAIAADKKTDDRLIKGCQSKVWLDAQLNEGLVEFTADSDAIITKGIVGILIRVFSNASPDAIVAADTGFIDQMGLKEHLSPTRANGLVSMVKQMKLYALAYQTQMEQS